MVRATAFDFGCQSAPRSAGDATKRGFRHFPPSSPSRCLSRVAVALTDHCGVLRFTSQRELEERELMIEGEVLVSVEHDDGLAGIIRDGDVVRLSGYLGDSDYATVLDGYWSSMEGLIGERSAEAGLLP